MSQPTRSIPHEPAAERAVLGCMVLDSACIADVCDALMAEDFYADVRGKIFGAIVAASRAGKGVDSITVEGELRARGCGDEASAELAACLDRIPGDHEKYAARVAKLAVARRLMQTALRVVSEGYEPIGDVDEYLDRSEAALRRACDQRKDNVEIQSLGQAIEGVFADWETRSRNPGNLRGVPSGITLLDRTLSGFQRGKLYVIAGGTGAGKTAAALQFAEHCAQTTRTAVAVFSLEMLADELATRSLSARSGVNSRRITTGEGMMSNDAARITSAAGEAFDVPLFIPSSTSLNPHAIRRISRKLRGQKGGLSMIVIDYLQIVRVGGRGDNREQEVAAMSGAFKSLAMELEVPVLLLSQLNREYARRPNKRPQLSDLRESGAIEHDADVVIFVYRDEMYDPDSADKGIAEFIVGKHRGGPTGVIKTRFTKECTRFDNLEQHHSTVEHQPHWSDDR